MRKFMTITNRELDTVLPVIKEQKEIKDMSYD